MSVTATESFIEPSELDTSFNYASLTSCVTGALRQFPAFLHASLGDQLASVSPQILFSPPKVALEFLEAQDELISFAKQWYEVVALEGTMVQELVQTSVSATIPLARVYGRISERSVDRDSFSSVYSPSRKRRVLLSKRHSIKTAQLKRRKPRSYIDTGDSEAPDVG